MYGNNNIIKIFFSHEMPRIADIIYGRVELPNKYWQAGEEIKAYLLDWEKMDGFPKMRLYSPFDYMPFICMAYIEDIVDDKGMQKVHENLIAGSDLIIDFGDHATTLKNLKVAREYGVPVFNAPYLDEKVIQSLRFTIKLILSAD